MSWDEAKYWRDLWHEEQRAHAALAGAVLAGNGYEHLMGVIRAQIAEYEARVANDAVLP
jgi:hypothetical protein